MSRYCVNQTQEIHAEAILLLLNTENEKKVQRRVASNEHDANITSLSPDFGEFRFKTFLLFF